MCTHLTEILIGTIFYCVDQIDVAVPTVICGDFNCVFDRALDRRRSEVSDTSRESTVALKNLFNECCVFDFWRSLHPASSVFTWLRPDGSFSSRIDFFGCTLSWSHCVVSCDIISCPYSDHSAVVLDCGVPSPLPRGPGRWILNGSSLADPVLIASVKAFWLQ